VTFSRAFRTVTRYKHSIMSKDAKQVTSGVRLRVAQRSQVVWAAGCLDDRLPPQHQARTIWAVVEALDLSAFEQPIKARDGVCGRDRTDPRILVTLWLYATVRGIGSARELARLCQEGRPYEWICGGVTVNHRLLGDFRTDHGDALDGLFTNVIATLVKQGLVKVKRISQDGLRVRASAGSSSFRRGSTLATLRGEAAERVEQLRALLEDPARSAGLSARQRAAKARAVDERLARIEEARKLIPRLQARQERSARRLSKRQQGEQQKEPRASTSDGEAMRMKMGDGGYRPALNVQLACDTDSRAIVGVSVTNEGVDYEQSEPMRAQVQRRTGRRIDEHLYDGGYVKTDGIERADAQGVTVYAPPKPPKNNAQRGDGSVPRKGDGQAIVRWRERMGSDAGKAVYKQRASTSETVNAQMRRSGLVQLTVRGVGKVTCVALWSALAYNVVLFATALRG
jgi:transposase